MTRLHLIVTLTALGCAPSLPVPVAEPHPVSEVPLEVQGQPPDAVRVQTIPASPSPDAVWIDGHWHWVGRRWVWEDGYWCIPKPDSYYSHPRVVGVPVPMYAEIEGRQQLVGMGISHVFFPGHWHNRSDGAIVNPSRSPKSTK